MICTPCREPHQPDDCVDAVAGREGPNRGCFCQHHPRVVVEDHVEDYVEVDAGGQEAVDAAAP